MMNLTKTDRINLLKESIIQLRSSTGDPQDIVIKIIDLEEKIKELEGEDSGGYIC